MILLELFDPGVQGYQDIEADNSKPVWRTSRKTKLTLKQIRKLRRMLDVRNYERRIYLKKIQSQYGPQAGAEGAAPTL
jgi:hypothetical protein